MCLLVFAWEAHPHYSLIFAGNRDEFHQRPAAPADWWGDPAGLLAGRDLQAGGTWLGITRTGRFGVVTNYRDLSDEPPKPRSRGELIPMLAAAATPQSFLERSGDLEGEYAGFNLIFGDARDLHYISNRAATASPLPAGIHGLSNHALNTPWPKLERVRQRFTELLGEPLLDPEQLLGLLADRWQPPHEQLPDTGIGEEWERLLSSPFIVSPRYGTRCSTVVLITRAGQVCFVERRFDAAGQSEGTSKFEFQL